MCSGTPQSCPNTVPQSGISAMAQVAEGRKASLVSEAITPAEFLKQVYEFILFPKSTALLLLLGLIFIKGK